jgi:H2-forming N5,N10-methylenetetrahydromethanopterin dehydrogenase-like enzyme
VVDLLLQCGALLSRECLGVLPVVLVEALSCAPTLRLVCVLFQLVEHLLHVHAVVLGVIQAHAAAIRGTRELAYLLVGVGLDNHPVNNVVRSGVGQLRVLVEQLAPHRQVPQSLVHRLMQTDEAQLWNL